jgi:choline-sulfatase
VLDRRLGKRPDLAPDEIAALRANYAGNVTLIDDQVGKILEVIGGRGEMERTAVAVVSDHGELNGDHGLLFKSVFLGSASRIPFILRMPESPTGGTVCSQPVELMDLGPTLVELAGGRLRGRNHARSLLPVLHDPNIVHRTDALSEIHREQMLATEEWKIAVNRSGEPYLLFDLRRDPCETTNLAGLPEHADVERDLVRRMCERVKASRR